jgi:hypothetical protein
MSMGPSQLPQPSRYTPADQIGPRPDAHPHISARKPRRHLLRKLTSRLRRKPD